MKNFELAKDLFLDGINLLERKSFLEAEEKFQESLKIIPDRVSTLLNLSATQIQLKKFNEAEANLIQAIKIDGVCAEAFLNLGLIQVKLRNFELALQKFNDAIKLNPHYPEAWSNKGNTLNELKRFEEAIAAYDQAIKLNPQYPEAWSNKGNTLNELKRFEEAIAAYDRAIKLNPEKTPYLGNRLHIKMAIAEWENLDSDINLITEKIKSGHDVSEPFPLLSLVDDPSLHLETARIVIGNRFPSSRTPSLIAKKIHPKIRVGYFSPDFKSHPVSFLMAELFALHDRNHFETFAFSLQPSNKNDLMRPRLLKAFDHFLDLENKSDLEIAQISRDLEIDIAINLGGHTQNSRMGIFSYRAAPIQVNYLGYPGTLGADYFDYIVGDTVLIPPSSKEYYLEKIIYLPNSFMVDDSRRLPSIKQLNKEDYGLPINHFVFCCFNNGYKFNKLTLKSWAKILLNTDKSVLWISENNSLFRRNILKEFSLIGVPAERIVFAKYVASMEEHLKRYQLADLFLDTLPFNAHTTAVDALKAGLPFLTLAGKAFAGRVGASLLTALDLKELITLTRDDYETLALDLAHNPNKLAEIKRRLSDNLLKTSLFNTRLFTKHLESAYEQMYQRYKMDLLPDHLLIG